MGWVWWFIAVIPATRAVEAKGLWFETSQGTVSSRSYLKNRLKTSLASAKPRVQAQHRLVVSLKPRQ
jgi:hypothetical protein